MEKVSNPNDDVSSCSSVGAGDGSSTGSSQTNTKQSHAPSDIDCLPPNKRRVRERNAGLTSNYLPSLPTDPPSINSDTSPTETITNREVPINSIKQFLDIRQQVNIVYIPLIKKTILFLCRSINDMKPCYMSSFHRKCRKISLKQRWQRKVI